MTRDWLIELRGSRTQEDIAKLGGIHRSSYAHYELGTRSPEIPIAKRLGYALGFDWTRFYEDKCCEKTN